MSWRVRRTTAVLAICVFAACSAETVESTSTTFNLGPICQQIADDTADRIQDYIDQFADASLADFSEGELPGLDELRTDIDGGRAEALNRGCHEQDFETRLALEARELSGRGPVGRPLAAMLRGFDPTAIEATTVDLEPGDDLPAELAELGAGSVVELAAGDYELEEVLLIDRALTITGAGKDHTRIRSSAPESALLVIQGGELELAELSIEHTGESPASVVVSSAASGLTMDSVRVTGGVADAEGESGGHGLLILGGAEGSARSRVTNSEFVDNDRIGISLFGSALVAVQGGVVSGNGACGICLFEEATAAVEGTLSSGNQVGMGASGNTRLRVTDSEVSESTAAGLIAEGSANVTMRGSTLSGNETGVQSSGASFIILEDNTLEGGRAGLVFLGDSRGIIIDNEITGSEVGLQVGDRSAPVVRANNIAGTISAGVLYTGSVGGLLADNTLSDAGNVAIQIAGSADPTILGNDIRGPSPFGVTFTEDGAGRLFDNVVSGFEGGVQISGNSAPDVERNTFEDLTTYSIVAFQNASGTIVGNYCAPGVPGIVLVGGADPDLEENDCTVVRG